MGFDTLLDQAGGMGRFQILQLVLFCITSIIAYPHFILENFTAAIPGHRCWVHILDNDTVSSNDTGIFSQEALLRVSIPLDSNLKPEKCRRFTHPQWQLLDLNETFSNTGEPDTEPCVDGWVYDRSFFLSTIVTEWDLVCESQSLKSLVQTLFMTGSLLGGLINGYLSDRFGRKMTYIGYMFQLAIVETCVAFAPTFPVYCLLRFLAGFFALSVMINSFILVTEWTGTKHQSIVVMLILCSYNLGQIILGGLAFATRNWHTLHLIVSIPLFILFVPSRNLAESARWLITQNQPDKALKELRRVARINGKGNTEETLTIEFVKSTMQEELDAAQIKASIFQLLRVPKLRMRICVLWFVRLANVVPFYGLILNLQHLGSNIFLFQVLFGVVMIIGRYFTLLTQNCMDRRTSQTLFLFVAGVSILVTTYLSQEMQILRVAVATLGTGAISIAITAFAFHQNELVPTTLRATIGGVNAMFSRIGAVLAPLLMMLMVYSPQLPWIIYGIFAILAGLAVLYLPDTRNRPLINTIQDMVKEIEDTRNLKPEATTMKVTQF